jgi:hypothetical protein
VLSFGIQASLLGKLKTELLPGLLFGLIVNERKKFGNGKDPQLSHLNMVRHLDQLRHVVN